MKINGKVRLNIQVPCELKDYIEEQAYLLGISQNAFIGLCLLNHKCNNSSSITLPSNNQS